MTTESYSPIDILKQYYGNSTKLGAQVPFNFGFVHINKHKIVLDIDSKINMWLSNIPENNVANWVVSVLQLYYTKIYYNIFSLFYFL